MKKQTLRVILPLCVAMTMTACGGNADTAEVEETMVTTDNSEADTQAKTETEAPTVDEEVVESEQTEDGAPADEEPLEEIEIEPEEEHEFPYLTERAVEQDKSADYGVYSTSCFDVDQFIGEDGMRTAEWDFESKEYSEYSGRFAYPKVTECRFTTDAKIDSRTDVEEEIFTTDSVTGNSLQIYFSVGRDDYDTYSHKINWSDDPNVGLADIIGTVKTGEEYSELIHFYRVVTGTLFDDGLYYVGDGRFIKGVEGDTEELMMNVHHYVYTLGNFTVDVLFEGEEGLTLEDIQLIADNIHLVDNVAE